jgi:hypothetical protein
LAPPVPPQLEVPVTGTLLPAHDPGQVGAPGEIVATGQVVAGEIIAEAEVVGALIIRAGAGVVGGARGDREQAAHGPNRQSGPLA